MAIKQFSDMELFDMFNIDIMPDADHKDGDRRQNVDERYAFNDIKCQLWSKTKRQLSRGERNALQSDDYCTISHHQPGSAERIADLAAHYQGVDGSTTEDQHQSAFSC